MMTFDLAVTAKVWQKVKGETLSVNEANYVSDYANQRCGVSVIVRKWCCSAYTMKHSCAKPLAHCTSCCKPSQQQLVPVLC